MQSIYSFLTSHNLHGRWFLPGKEAAATAGRLSFSRENIVLEMFEPFKNDGDDRSAEPVIFGITDQEQEVSIFHCLKAKGNFDILSGREMTTSFWPHSIIIGAHIDAETAEFSSLYARVPGLAAWRKVPVLSHRERLFDETGGANGFEYHVHRQESQYRLDSMPGQLKLASNVRLDQKGFGCVSIATEGWVEINPDIPQSLDQLLKTLNKTLSLIGLLAGPCMHYDAIRLVRDGEWMDVLFRPNRHATCTIDDPHSFFIPSKAVVDQLPAVLNTWLSAMPTLETVNALFEGVLVAEDTPLHIRFLTLTHVLEGFHRATRPGLYMDADAWEKISDLIIKAIPGIEPFHRDSLRNRISYGNQISFRKRLDELSKSLPDAMKMTVIGQKSGAPAIWVDTRNYYTHWEKDPKKPFAEGATLAYVITRMTAFARILLLRHAGVKDEAILEALKGRSRWARELKNVAEQERSP